MPHAGFPQEPARSKIKQNYQFFNCILFLPQSTVNPFSVNSWACCPLPLSAEGGSLRGADRFENALESPQPRKGKEPRGWAQ